MRGSLACRRGDLSVLCDRDILAHTTRVTGRYSSNKHVYAGQVNSLFYMLRSVEWVPIGLLDV
jgi:hypothetical protein